MHRTAEEIKEDILSNIKNTMDKSENSLIYDAVAPASIEFASTYEKLEATKGKLDIENNAGVELEKFVAQRSGIDRKQAIKAVGLVTIAGAPETVIGEGTMVSTGAIDFIIKQTKEIGLSGFEEVLVECDVAGAIGNVPEGAIKEFPVTIQGLVSVTNEYQATGGYDAEADAELRTRYYERIRAPATSGNKYHYINWAKEVQGVGDARAIPLWNGAGTVKVVVIDVNKLPASTGLITSVESHIEEERPIGADVTIVAAIAKKINISVVIIKSESFTLEQIRLKIIDSVTSYLSDIAFKQNIASSAKIGSIILSVEGVLDYSDLLLNSAIGNVPIGNEEIATLNEVVLNEPAP